jgi:Transglycosylase
MPRIRHSGPPSPQRTLRLVTLLAVAAVVVAVLLTLWAGSAMRSTVAGRIRAEAKERGLSTSWRSLAVTFPGRVRLSGLGFYRAADVPSFAYDNAVPLDTVFRAESLVVEVSPWSVLTLSPRVSSARLAHARILLIPRAGVDPDTLAPEEPDSRANATARYERIRRSADRLVRVLLAPARTLPRLSLEDVSVRSAQSEDALIGGAHLGRLELEPAQGGIRLAARGQLLLERPVPFDVGLAYQQDDRLTGRARFMIPSGHGGQAQPLRVMIDGRLAQNRGRGVVELEDGAKITIGTLPLRLAGSVAKDGPRFSFRLEADSITQQLVVESLPAELLGPLRDLSVRGSFDYRLGFDLDLAQPDRVTLDARVIPHGLALDPGGTHLRLFGLNEPFVAAIHLPRGRIETRELSPANPHFRILSDIDSVLVHAVVTNEDGGFFHHRGFNIEAVKNAVSTNLKAGAFRRGAGTITMQLARNLYLGHERTLSRKVQEMVLAWVLEHLTGVPKRRLLEIYLNIIEWGPGVHGADEATRYYFDRSAAPGQVTVDEGLFLSTVLPSPRKWRYRFGSDGNLRPFERAQMHFIGRAMIAKGWLSAERLPPTESMYVELRGAARGAMFPKPDTLAAPARDTTSI